MIRRLRERQSRGLRIKRRSADDGGVGGVGVAYTDMDDGGMLQTVDEEKFDEDENDINQLDVKRYPHQLSVPFAAASNASFTPHPTGHQTSSSASATEVANADRLLDAIQVQISPPSTVDPQQRIHHQVHYSDKLSRISKHHRHLQLNSTSSGRSASPATTTTTGRSSSQYSQSRAPSPLSFSTNPTSRTLNTFASTASSSANSTAVIGDVCTNTAHLTAACGMDNPCFGVVNNSMEDFNKINLSNLDSTFSTYESSQSGEDVEADNCRDTSTYLDLESAFFQESVTGDVSEVDADEVTDAYREAMDDLEKTVRSASLVTGGKNGNNLQQQQHRRHAYDYQPTPPQRRSKKVGAKGTSPKSSRFAKKNNTVVGGNVDVGQMISTTAAAKIDLATKEVSSVHVDSASRVSPPPVKRKKGTLLITSSHHGEMTTQLEDSTIGEGTVEGGIVTSETDPVSQTAASVAKSQTKPSEATQEERKKTEQQVQRAVSPPRSSAPTMKHSNSVHLIGRLLRNTLKKKEGELQNHKENEENGHPKITARKAQHRDPTPCKNQPDPPPDPPAEQMSRIVHSSAKRRPLVDPRQISNNFIRQQRQNQQSKRQQEYANNQEWTAPLPFKKVSSTPSNYDSLFTFQTSNTTSTSKFWDEVEVFSVQQQKKDSSNQKVTSFESGLHGNLRMLKGLGDQDYVILRKSNEKNQELQEFFKSHKSNVEVVDGNQQQQKQRQPFRSQRKSQQQIAKNNQHSIDPPNSKDDDSVSKAFSLDLPVNKHGQFDDGDISALEMGDSATVYHLRATVEAKTKASTYWKEKYDRLKEKTIENGVAFIEEEEEELVEIEQGTDGVPKMMDQDEKQPWTASSLEALQNLWSNGNSGGVNKNDQSQVVQQQPLLLGCGHYGGGKKAKDAANKTDSNTTPATKQSGSSKVELESMLRLAQCTRRGPESDGIGDGAHETPKQSPVIGTMFSQDEEYDESMNSHLVPGGYVRVNTPSPNLIKALPKKSQHIHRMDPPLIAEELTAYSAQPTFIMDDENDAHFLQQWYRQRSKSGKALADDLTAGVSRGMTSRGSSADGSQVSELSENAKLIFEAALKYDVDTLHRQRSLSEASRKARSRSPKPNSRSASPREDIRRALSNISSIAASASVVSSHIGTNIPNTFSTWFELPSLGTSCISLLPLFDSSFRGPVVIELLSAFDGETSKLGGNSASRIAPRHRVSDVIDRMFNEFSSADSDATENEAYMGPVVADGDDGSIRFANAALHLGGISDVAVSHIKVSVFVYAVPFHSGI